MISDNDSEFKSALAKLPKAAQRQLGARFAESVMALCNDARVKRVIGTAKRADLTDEELEVALDSARKASVDSFTQCGKECDWHSQAGHFVAEAALACLKSGAAGSNQAWEAAMHARMARTSESIATGIGTDNAEAATQYRILAEFMKD